MTLTTLIFSLVHARAAASCRPSPDTHPSGSLRNNHKNTGKRKTAALSNLISASAAKRFPSIFFGNAITAKRRQFSSAEDDSGKGKTQKRKQIKRYLATRGIFKRQQIGRYAGSLNCLDGGQLPPGEEDYSKTMQQNATKTPEYPEMLDGGRALPETAHTRAASEGRQNPRYHALLLPILFHFII